MERKITIRLPEKQYYKLSAYADKMFQGNISKAIRSIVGRYIQIFDDFDNEDLPFN